MGTEAVRITAGRKDFDSGARALSGIDLTISDGEFLSVLGRSGSGKSTLLRVIAGLEQLTAGTVEWPGDGDDVSRPHTGVVFQQPLLMPWLTVRENIAFGGRFAAHRGRFDRDHAENLLTGFGLASLADRYPDQLSGGQAQRVSIIRAAAIRPRLLLLDEPFSALDPAIRGDLRDWVGGLATELAVTVVLVTHDVDEAIALADRIVLLSAQGTVAGEWDIRAAQGDTDGQRAEILDHYRAVAPEHV